MSAQQTIGQETPSAPTQSSLFLQGLPPTLNVEQAGELLGISTRSAYRAAAKGELPTFKVGRRLLVPTARILDMLGLAETSEETYRASDTAERR